MPSRPPSGLFVLVLALLAATSGTASSSARMEYSQQFGQNGDCDIYIYEIATYCVAFLERPGLAVSQA